MIQCKCVSKKLRSFFKFYAYHEIANEFLVNVGFFYLTLFCKISL